MNDVNSLGKGSFWRAITMFFVCADFSIIGYLAFHFIKVYRALSSLQEEVSSYTLHPLDNHQLYDDLVHEFIIRVSVIVIITGISLFCIIMRRYKIAAFINGIPLVLLAIYIAIMAYAFSRG
jgi:hypothetical protein